MIHFRALGTLQVSRDELDVADLFAQPKRLALFAYLILETPASPKRRDALLAMFWPELDESHARHSLSQALHFLRRSLGESIIVTRSAGEVGLDRDQISCDVWDFQRHLEQGNLEAALDAYSGDLLAAFHVGGAEDFGRWLEETRASLRYRAVVAAHAMAERAVASGDRLSVPKWAERAARLDPLDERAIRRLMRARDAIGDRAGALREYRDFTAHLARELDAEPAPETRDLAEAIRSRDEPEFISQDYVFKKGARPSVPQAPPPREGAPAIHPTAVPTPPPSRHRIRSTAAIAVGLLVTLGAASVAIASRGHDPHASLVVLPFDDMGAGGTDQYLADGLTEDLTTVLSTARGLRVASRTSAFALRDKKLDVRDIGKLLRVSAALEGSVRREGGTLRVTAQLIDARTGYHIWSNVYDRPLEDIFTVQREIQRSVSNALHLSDGHDLTERPVRSAQAYDLYLRGRYQLRSRTRDHALAAIEDFERATAIDTVYPEAYAGLADAYAALAEFIPPRDILPKAKAAAMHALRLDSADVETRLAVADLYLIYDHDWAAAEREYRAAVRLAPRSAMAHERYARFLAAARRFDEHVAMVRTSLDLRRAEEGESGQLTLRDHVALGSAAFAARRYEEALTHCRQALALDARSWSANAVAGRTYVELQRYDDAIAALRQAWPVSKQLPALARLGYAYGRAGRTAEARAILAQLQARSDTMYVPKDQIALVHLGLGDRDAAITWLYRAHEERHWWLPWINQSPPFDALRTDQRYLDLLRQLGAP